MFRGITVKAIDIMLKSREEFIPKTGFSVIGIDDFELIGEELYLVENFDNEEDAKKLANTNDNYFIISSSDNTPTVKADVDPFETEFEKELLNQITVKTKRVMNALKRGEVKVKKNALQS